MEKAVYEFISKATSDPIVERRTCRRTGKPFAISQSEKDLLERLSPTIGGRKFNFSLPTQDPLIRQLHRFAFRNERKLYKRKCDLSGKSIVTLYPPEFPGKVYDQHIRRGDKRNPMEYKLEYKKGQFIQLYKQLLDTVPRLSIINKQAENAEYNNFAVECKNSYLTFGMWRVENVYHSNYGFHDADCVDVLRVSHSQLLYECIECSHCYNLKFSMNCESCQESEFLVSCRNTKNCFMCWNLRNQEYCIKNIHYSKEEYYQKVQELKEKYNYTELKQLFANNYPNFIFRNMELLNCEQSIGDRLSNAKDMTICFDSDDCEHCKFGFQMDAVDYGMDMSCMGYDQSENIYQTVGCSGLNRCYCCDACRNNRDIFYCNACFGSSNLFGCVGLKNKQYCILNKQYTKDERETLVPSIIDELQQQNLRGSFFPIELSVFPYNDTVSNDYDPVKERGKITILKPGEFISDAIIDLGGEEKVKIKWRTKESEINVSENIKLIKSENIPDDIKNVDDLIVDNAIVCETSGRPFRIVAPELAFYRKHELPLPRKHPDIRHQERLAKRPGRELFLRTCDKCGIEMLSVYPSESKFKVYCESCYNKEIYG